MIAMDTSTQVGIEELLAWYREAGVDEPLAAAPIDRFAQVIAEPKPARRRLEPAVELPRGPAPMPARTGPNIDAVAAAVALAADAPDLQALKTSIETFDGCSLRRTARSTLFGLGEPGSRLAIVGDVPDRDEDAEGVPFAGSGGAMLQRMLGAIGVDVDDTYRLSASPWSASGRFQLQPDDKAMLAPLLARHVELARPELVLLMGGTATELLLGPGPGTRSLRGRWSETTVGEHPVGVLPTFAPRLLIAQPQQKRLAWADLLRLKERL